MVDLYLINDRVRFAMGARYLERRGNALTHNPPRLLRSLILDTLVSHQHYVLSGRPFCFQAWSGEMHQPIRRLALTKISTGFNAVATYDDITGEVAQFDLAHAPETLPLTDPLHEDGAFSFQAMVDVLKYGIGTLATRWRNRHVEMLAGLLLAHRMPEEWEVASRVDGIREALAFLTPSVTVTLLSQAMEPISDDELVNRMSIAAWYITCRYASLQRERSTRITNLDGVQVESSAVPWPSMLQWATLAHEDLLVFADNLAPVMTANPAWQHSTAMRMAATRSEVFGATASSFRMRPAAYAFPAGRAPIIHIPATRQRISGQAVRRATPVRPPRSVRDRLPSSPEQFDDDYFPDLVATDTPEPKASVDAEPTTMSEAFDALRNKTAVSRQTLISLFSITPEAIRLLEEAIDIDDHDARTAMRRDVREAMRRHLQKLTGLPVTVEPGETEDSEALIDSMMLALCHRLMPRGEASLKIKVSDTPELVTDMIYWRGPTRWFHGRELRKAVTDKVMLDWFEELSELPNVHRKVRRAAKFKRMETISVDKRKLFALLDVGLRIFDERTKLGDTISVQSLVRIIAEVTSEGVAAAPGAAHGKKRQWGSTPVENETSEDDDE